MHYGFCTYFSSETNERVDYDLLKNIAAAGFDFVELPLFLVERISEAEFRKLQAALNGLGLPAEAAANLFP